MYHYFKLSYQNYRTIARNRALNAEFEKINFLVAKHCKEILYI